MAKFISEVHPSQTFPYGQKETIKKCVNLINSEKKLTLMDVDPNEGEVRVVYRQIGRWLDVLTGTDNAVLIRFSFDEIDGNTTISASVSKENGVQDFYDGFGAIEKFIKKIYSQII